MQARLTSSRRRWVDSPLLIAALFGVSAATVAVACSSTQNTSGFTDTTTTTTGTNTGGGPSTGPGMGGNNTGGTGGINLTVGSGGHGGTSGTGTIDPDAACATGTAAATLIPLNILFVWDQSGSMSEPTATGTKWTDLQSAFTTFINDPASVGLSVAIRFFPEDSGPQNPKNYPLCDDNTFSCVVAGNQDVINCSVPSVPLGKIGPGPMDPQINALTVAVGDHGPQGGTPMFQALAGGERFAQQYQALHKSEKTVVVLMTDGIPNDCDQEIPMLAAQALANMNVNTYAVGLAGSMDAYMDSIAMAGGTGQAFKIGNGNAVQDLEKAMKQIQSAGVGCKFQMPMGMNVDPNLVNVNYTKGGMGKPDTLPNVKGPADCTAKGGWYYDDPMNPTQIILCPASCQAISMDPLAKIDIILGCKSVIP